MSDRSAALTKSAMFALLLGSLASAQTAITPDLTAIPGGTGWTVFNRAVTVTDRDGRPVAEFDARPGDGMARLDGVVFTSGEIECDIQGHLFPTGLRLLQTSFRFPKLGKGNTPFEKWPCGLNTEHPTVWHVLPFLGIPLVLGVGPKAGQQPSAG